MIDDGPDCGLMKGEHVNCRGQRLCRYRRRASCRSCGATVVSVREEFDGKAICSIQCWDKLNGEING